MLERHVSDALRRSDVRIVITGANGWLGRATSDLLVQCFGEVLHSRLHCFGSRPRLIPLGNGVCVEQRPLDEIANLPPAPTFLLHLAFLTKDVAEAMDEDDYRAANQRISSMVRDALSQIGCKGVFLASSGAAHFADDVKATPAMRLYGELKRDDERAFADWARMNGCRLVTARIHNLSGPHINKTDSYALATFILDALAGGPIRVRAPHEVWRGYVAIRELMSLVFALLLDGSSEPICFDTGGDTIELGELANAIAGRCGGLKVERPSPTGGLDRYVGDNRMYMSLLRQYGIASVPLEQQIAETMEYIAKTMTLTQSPDWPKDDVRASRGCS